MVVSRASLQSGKTSGDSGWAASSMMTCNDAVVMQQFCMLMTFNDALPVWSTKNDGHCHHSRMEVFPDPQSNNIEGLARETRNMGAWGPLLFQCFHHPPPPIICATEWLSLAVKMHIWQPIPIWSKLVDLSVNSIVGVSAFLWQRDLQESCSRCWR